MIDSCSFVRRRYSPLASLRVSSLEPIDQLKVLHHGELGLAGGTSRLSMVIAFTLYPLNSMMGTLIVLLTAHDPVILFKLVSLHLVRPCGDERPRRFARRLVLGRLMRWKISREILVMSAARNSQRVICRSITMDTENSVPVNVLVLGLQLLVVVSAGRQM